MNYQFSVLVRKNLVLLKNGLKRDGMFSLFQTLRFSVSYSLGTWLSSSQKKVNIRSKKGTNVTLRTRSSDLEVFIQHYIYRELFALPGLVKNDIPYILDAGANIGITALILAELFPKAHLIAIEPEEQNFRMLQHNCDPLVSAGRLHLMQGVFYPDPNATLEIAKEGHADWGFKVKTAGKTQVKNDLLKIITLRDICVLCGNKNPSLIKMDIEGSEVAFFRDEAGFKEILDHSFLLVELHGPEAYLEYFSSLKKNKSASPFKLGEFWGTSPLNQQQ